MILSKILQKFKVLASKLSKFLFKIAHYTSYKTQYEESNISVRQSDLVLGYFHLFLFLLCTCKKHLVFVVLVLKCCTWLFFPHFIMIHMKGVGGNATIIHCYLQTLQLHRASEVKQYADDLA